MSLPPNNDEPKTVTYTFNKSDFLSTYRNQNWSKPDSLIYYISKNPLSPTICQKLSKTCKYFIIKNPILVIPDLSYFTRNGWKPLCLRTVVKSRATNICKIWISGHVSIVPERSAKSKLLSSLVPKISQCDISMLQLTKQVFTFKDFVFLIKFAKQFWFFDVTVRDENGTIVGLEQLVEVAPKVQRITLNGNRKCLYITSKTVTELLKIPHFSKLISLILHNVPDTFDIETFYNYMKENKSTHWELKFHATISQEYKIRLEEIIDELNAKHSHPFMILDIWFNGLDTTKHNQLQGKIYKPLGCY